MSILELVVDKQESLKKQGTPALESGVVLCKLGRICNVLRDAGPDKRTLTQPFAMLPLPSVARSETCDARSGSPTFFPFRYAQETRASQKDLPERFRRPVLSAQEMAMVDVSLAPTLAPSPRSEWGTTPRI